MEQRGFGMAKPFCNVCCVLHTTIRTIDHHSNPLLGGDTGWEMPKTLGYNTHLQYMQDLLAQKERKEEGQFIAVVSDSPMEGRRPLVVGVVRVGLLQLKNALREVSWRDTQWRGLG